MVYYNTSKNIKMLRDIIIDYRTSQETSPYEYMKMYIEKLPETVEDSKISWIVETFLSIQKHSQFLKKISSHISQELSEEDQDYFEICFHAITFQISPTNLQLLYKCLFNLSRNLLNIFTKFLSNNEVLTVITQIAQNEYDTHFITEKIINPLFTWQPYISEMGHNYAEYVKKIERRKIKLSTIPIQPNVLNRRGKNTSFHNVELLETSMTPSNSLHTKTKKMLTKSTIDQKLKQIHENNKQKAEHLLQSVKSDDHHYCQGKSDKNQRKNGRFEIANTKTKVITKPKLKLLFESPPTVKDTAANLKRLNNRILMSERKDVQWLEDLLVNCKNTKKVEELEFYDRQEKERERLLDIERKHLVGQISYEEAVIAKKKLIDDNKKKYEVFLKEKQVWEEEIERWRRNEMEKNRKKVEKLSLIELEMLHARNNVTVRKKEFAEKIRKETEEILARALIKKQEELEQKIKMIKEINILTQISKKTKLPKIVDLTETSGLGFLCEMSIAELQERLNALKIGLKEELDKKRLQIKEENLAAKQDLEDAKKNITNYMTELADTRKQKRKSKIGGTKVSCIENDDLKKVLEERRKLRIHLTS